MRTLALSALLFFLAGCPNLLSPADRVRAAIEALGAGGTTLELAGGRSLEIPPGSIEALAVDAGSERGGSLEAFSQLAIEGRTGGLLVSYVGNERVRVGCAARCRIEAPFAPRLTGVLEALWARRDALEGGDLATLERLAARSERWLPPTREELEVAAAREASAWFIRVEGRTAVVGEAAPDGKQRRLGLVREEEGWAFTAGLP